MTFILISWLFDDIHFDDDLLAWCPGSLMMIYLLDVLADDDFLLHVLADDDFSALCPGSLMIFQLEVLAIC